MATRAEQIELARELQALANKLLGVATKLLGEPLVLAPEPEPKPEPEFEFELAFEEEERPPRPEQDVGRFGVVNIGVARVKAAQLGEFDRRQFAQALGLGVAKAGKWLDKLKEADLVEFVDGSFRSLVAPELRDWVVAADGSFKVEEAAEAISKTLEETQAELEEMAAKEIIVSVNGNGLFRYNPPTDPGVPTSRPHRLPEWREKPCGELSQATGMPVRVAAVKKATRAQRSTAGAGGVKGPKQRDKRFNQMKEARQAKAEERRLRHSAVPTSSLEPGDAVGQQHEFQPPVI